MKDRQVSFAAGELSPTLWGRTDIASYASGARTLRNFLVTSHGILMNRPGTTFIKQFTSLEAIGATVRLARFQISETEFCLLMLAATNLHVFERDAVSGEFVLNTTLDIIDGAENIQSMQFAQTGDTLTVVSGAAKPREFKRFALGTYSFTEISFAVPDFPTIRTGNVKLLKATATPAFEGDASHPPREWKWAVTRLMRRYSDGTLYETAPLTVSLVYDTGNPTADIVTPDKVAIYPDWAQSLKISLDPHLSLVTDPFFGHDTLVGSRIYRGRDGTYGYVGEKLTGETGTVVEWVDDGQDPDYANQPPRGINPFIVRDGSGAFLREEAPSVVAFFENRRFFSSTAERPRFVWASAIGDYSNFDEIVLANDDDALSFGLASSKMERVVALVARRQLLALTSSTEWLITGSGQGTVITPNSIAAHPITEHGSSLIAPLSVSSAILHVQAKGSAPHALVFGPDGASFQSADVSLLSRHLFDGHTIVDWAYARDPYSIAWVARSDGALLSLTYLPGQEAVAWAHHDLADDGVVETVITIPEGDEDTLYMVVRRDSGRSLEKLASRRVLDAIDAVFLDRSVSYNGYDVVTNLIGLTATVTDGYSTGGQVGDDTYMTMSGDIGDIDEPRVFQLDDPDDGNSVRFAISERITGNTFRATVLDNDVPDSMWGVTMANWADCTHVVHGLDHLEGLAVTALAAGNVVEGLTVTGGAVTLGDTLLDRVAIVHVGRPYVSEFESLAAVNERGKQKIVKQVFLEIDGARGGAIGPDLDNLTEVRTRDVSDSYAAIQLKRDELRMSVSGRWESTGYVAFRQSAPLPIAILGITRDIEYGG